MRGVHVKYVLARQLVGNIVDVCPLGEVAVRCNHEENEFTQPLDFGSPLFGHILCLFPPSIKIWLVKLSC